MIGPVSAMANRLTRYHVHGRWSDPHIDRVPVQEVSKSLLRSVVGGTVPDPNFP
jgi:hypothetical protein